MNDWLKARSFLAVRMDNAGDVVMLGPALRAVKEGVPDAQITLLCSPAGARASALLPWVDDVIVWRAMWQDVGHKMAQDPGRELELVERLRAASFDAALIFTSFSQCPHVPGYLCYLAGIPLRAGDSREFGGSSSSLELRDAPNEMHQAERNLRLVRACGFPVSDSNLAVSRDPEAARIVSEKLQDIGVDPHRKFVVLHPGASAEARRYPAALFGATARLLTRSGVQVVVTGTEREKDATSEVLAEAPQATGITGDTSMRQFAELVRLSDVVVCNNSLPLHLSDAVGTPVVVLFSGTDLEAQWAPRRSPAVVLRQPTPCHPCYLFTCPIRKPCLAVDPVDVASAVQSLMNQEGRPKVAAEPRQVQSSDLVAAGVT